MYLLLFCIQVVKNVAATDTGTQVKVYVRKTQESATAFMIQRTSTVENAKTIILEIQGLFLIFLLSF